MLKTSGAMVERMEDASARVVYHYRPYCVKQRGRFCLWGETMTNFSERGELVGTDTYPLGLSAFVVLLQSLERQRIQCDTIHLDKSTGRWEAIGVDEYVEDRDLFGQVRGFERGGTSLGYLTAVQIGNELRLNFYPPGWDFAHPEYTDKEGFTYPATVPTKGTECLRSVIRDLLTPKPSAAHNGDQVAPTEPPPTGTASQETKPWELIEDHLWDRQALELWHRGYTCREINEKTHVASEDRIRNRLTELRAMHGKEIVPTNDQRRKAKL